MKKSMLSRGFTLIELLVVIAIIGILAAVVISSLNDARSSGQDASAKQSLNNLRAQAEIYYNGNSFSYTGICADTDADRLLDAAVANTPATSLVTALATAGTATTVVCHEAADGGSWAASAPMNGGDYFCVDSTGFSGTRTNVLAASSAVCPAS